MWPTACALTSKEVNAIIKHNKHQPSFVFISFILIYLSLYKNNKQQHTVFLDSALVNILVTHTICCLILVQL